MVSAVAAAMLALGAIASAQTAGAAQDPAAKQREDWNRVYGAATGTPGAEPNAFLAEVVRGRAPGRALDIGIGQGRNSIFLAKLGWDVTGVDISDEAVRQTTERAGQEHVTVRALRQDFDEFDLGREQWDLIAGIYMGDLITKHAARIVAALKPGGVLVVENFQRDLNRPGRVGGAPLGYDVNELLNTFATLRVRRYEDTQAPADWARAGQPVPVVRLLAEKRR